MRPNTTAFTAALNGLCRPSASTIRHTHRAFVEGIVVRHVAIPSPACDAFRPPVEKEMIVIPRSVVSLGLCLAVTCAATGCSTAQSRIVRGLDGPDRVAGVPVLIDQPAFVEFSRVKLISGAARTEVGQKFNVRVVTLPALVFVDVPRPFAGSADLAVEYQAGTNRPTKITTKVVDKSIEDLTKLIPELAKVFKPAGGEVPSGPAGPATAVEEVVIDTAMYTIEPDGSLTKLLQTMPASVPSGAAATATPWPDRIALP